MKTASTLYEVPLLVENARVGELLLKRVGLSARRKPDLADWERMVAVMCSEKPSIRVALVGKYVELHDAYMSVREALRHAGWQNGVEVEIAWVHSGELEKKKGWDEVG